MDTYVNASYLYDRMVEVGICSNKRAAYRLILSRKKQGRFVYPKPSVKSQMMFQKDWINDIIFNLFDANGSGTWSVETYK